MSMTVKEAFEAQINKEFYSAYLYLDLSTQLKDMGLDGFANWMRVQAQEENAHATHMYDYALDRWEGIRMLPLSGPDVKIENGVQAFEASLAHEQFITKSINDIAGLALAQNDHAAYSFLTWYTNEQVEEEANAKGMLAKLAIIGSDASALLDLDRSLAARVFVDPFAGAQA